MPGWQLLSGPTEEPLTLEELKAHLRITTADATQDADLFRKLQAARRYIEDRTGPLLTQQWALWLDGFPALTYIDISKRPIISIDGVFYLDDDDVEYELDPEDYYYTDLSLGRIFLRTLATWPTDARTYQAVRVEVTAGYGSSPDDVPAPLLEAVAEMAGYLYYDREGVDPVPEKVQQICSAYEPAAV